MELLKRRSRKKRHKNCMVNEMQDLLDISTKCKESGIALPKYGAGPYNGIPPTSGFEVIANSVVSLTDVMTYLKEEMR